MDAGVELRIPSAPTVREVDHNCERSKAAVVHVGRGSGDLTKRGCFEGCDVTRSSCEPEPPGVRGLPVSPRDAGIVELLVREVRANVARRAARG